MPRSLRICLPSSVSYRRIRLHRDVEPDENLASEQNRILSEMVDKSRFAQYEVSNFAMKGWESKHNSAYWDLTPYLGLGPAAHSFDGTHRSWNAPTLSDYFAQIEQRKPLEVVAILLDDEDENVDLVVVLVDVLEEDRPLITPKIIYKTNMSKGTPKKNAR